jgi:RNA polymerase sigma factor for flagellar operon FliA
MQTPAHTPPISSAISEEALHTTWTDFRNAESPAAKAHLKDTLVRAHLSLVKGVAERLAGKAPRSVQLDDLYQHGVLGLLRAVDSFDLARGVQFKTYATVIIFGAIHDGLRQEDWVPRLVRTRTKLIDQAARELRMTHGREPTEEELAHALAMTDAEFKKIRHDGRRVDQLSLSTRTSSNGESAASPWEDQLSHPAAASPEEHARREDLKHFITQGLDRTERLLVVLYYYEELTMKEIGSALNISESRVSQLHSSIISRLKVRLAFSTEQFREE